MLLALFLVCFVALVGATVLLMGASLHVRFASRPAALTLIVVFAVVSGLVASRLWTLRATDVRLGASLLVAVGVVVVVALPYWNPIGQLFFGTFVASGIAYLCFGVATTFGSGISVVARIASFVLLLFEFAALALSTSFAFESCDATCRTRPTRPPSRFDADHVPMVSLQLATYDEPADMLIDTLRSLESLDYPDYEIVVIDNNTKDPDVWQPVADYCRDRPRLRFVHVDPWPGYKAGALNLALAEHTDPRAEIIGIVDSDYVIDASWLRSTVGYFADPDVAFVQSPQDYRDYEEDAYLRSCYDAYRYFFAVTMPSRHQRNSIIFAGTMGLLRRSAVEQVGAWDEWTITEDAELSLRLLKAGYSGVYEPRSFGRGIMPLTFAALKSQRFRWCFGGMQILRRHWRDLVPWNRDRDNRLSLAQRADYLIGNLQWTNDLVYFGFTIALLASAAVLWTNGPLGLRPLYGPAVLLPSALIASGLIRALWALRITTQIGWRRAVLAFCNWLSLSWTVALACVEGLTQSKGAFLRTPKTGEQNRLLAALWSAKVETLCVAALWGVALALALTGRATPFFLTLLAWQGVVYATAPFLSWLNQHTELSSQLERRRRIELWRERMRPLAPFSVGVAAAAAVALAIGALIGFGGSHPGHPANPFALEHAAPQPSRAPRPNPATTSSSQPNPHNPSSTSAPTPTTSASRSETTTSTGTSATTTTTVPAPSTTTTATTATTTPATTTATTTAPTTVGP